LPKLISLFLGFALLGGFALPAAAFTPDNGEISRLMQRHYGGLTSWEAVMTFPEQPGVSAHVWHSRGRWRQEWQGEGAARAVGVNGRVVAACTQQGFPLSPLFVWLPPSPVATWQSWGVGIASRSFGFCGDAPCLMLGAEPGDEVSPAVHLHNESGTPLLVRYRSGPGVITVRFGEYRTVGGFQVPQRLSVDLGGTTLEARVEWIAVNRADSDSLYALDTPDVAPCAEPPAPFGLLRDSFRTPTLE